uniref:Cytochrome c oxidase assembly protein COX16 homolog, mitochondrial n=1 Tax=Panagrolaimus superbus TaxID=310955 RepID=A0A914Y914_9BILA
MDNLKIKYKKMPKSNLNFLRVGLPFFAIVFGSAFGLHYFQQVRFDYSKVKKERDTVSNIHDSLEKAGVKVRKNLTVEDIYQEVAETDTENWENIRGPREFEDNQQYEAAKKRQKAEAEIKRKALKAKLKEEEALLKHYLLQQKQ